MTAKQGLKKDYVGQIYVALHNKNQEIFREWRFKPAFPFSPTSNGTSLAPMELDYLATGDTGIYKVSLNLQCDAYVENRIGAL